MLYFTIYKTTNLINGMSYIGQHITEDLENDDYIGSGIHFERAKKKYGKENFSREWLFIFDNFEEMDNKEAEIVNEEYVARSDNYNHKTGGKQSGLYHENSKKQISESLKKYFKENPGVQKGKKKPLLTQEQKDKISNGLKEHWKHNIHPNSFKKPWNAGKAGQLPPSIRKGISNGPMSEEQKIKISKTLKEKYSKQNHPLKGRIAWNSGKKTGKPAWNTGITMPKIICEHCLKRSDARNYKRWHGDNCKLRNNF